MRLAQKSIPTGLVYKQNEEVLEEVGAADLQKMLETRDWRGLEGMKVTVDIGCSLEVTVERGGAGSRCTST